MKRWKPKFTCADFHARICAENPTLKSYYGLDNIYCFVHDFVDLTNAAIKRGDFSIVTRHYNTIDEMFRNADDELLNVVSVGYIEHLAVHDSDGPNGVRAKCMMTTAMLNQWKELEAYWLGATKGPAKDKNVSKTKRRRRR
jgi:hypothetical protein